MRTLVVGLMALTLFLPSTGLCQALVGENLFLVSKAPHTDSPDLYFSHNGRSTSFTQYNGTLYYTNVTGERPLYIYGGAADGALSVHSRGVSIGGYNGTGLDVWAHDLSDIPLAKIRAINQFEEVALRTMLQLDNTGPVRFEFSNTSTGETWAFQTNNSDGFLINRLGSGGNEFSIRKSGMVTMGPGGKLNFILDTAGNLSIDGTLTQSSDRDKKEAFTDIDTRDILARVARLPISQWRYKDDPAGIRHIGPVSQDFRREFQVGQDDKTIATVDADGVALASIQALNERVNELVAENAQKERDAAIAAERIAALEQKLMELEQRFDAAF